MNAHPTAPAGLQWALLSPAPAAGVGPSTPGPLAPSLSLEGWLITDSGPGPQRKARQGGKRTFAWNVLLMPASEPFSWSQGTAAALHRRVCLWLEPPSRDGHEQRLVTNISYRIRSMAYEAEPEPSESLHRSPSPDSEPETFSSKLKVRKSMQ